MHHSFIYILANQKNGTIYVGVTTDLRKRVYEHRNNLTPGFTSRYNIHRLVYFEQYEDIITAITREKNIKKWKRKWKLNLIENKNPTWNDLFDSL